MTISPAPFALTRRVVFKAAMFSTAFWLATSLAFSPAAQAGNTKAATPLHPAVKYMQATATDLLRAQRKGTRKAFADVLARRADVDGIAMYSIGRYRGQLGKKQKTLYVRGVHQFMARYFAMQSKKYRVKKAVIEQTPRQQGKDWLVRSRVWLDNGSSYTPVWKLRKTRFGWRVVDVKVMGFSLTYLQRGLFYKFLQKRQGDVGALVMALNR